MANMSLLSTPGFSTVFRNSSARSAIGAVTARGAAAGPFQPGPNVSAKPGPSNLHSQVGSTQQKGAPYVPSQHNVSQLPVRNFVSLNAVQRKAQTKVKSRKGLKADDESSEDDIDPRDLLPASLGLGGSSDEEFEEARSAKRAPTALESEALDRLGNLTVGQGKDRGWQEDYRRGFRRKTSGGGGTTQWGTEVTGILAAIKKGVNVSAAVSRLRLRLGVPEWNKIMQAAGSRSWNDAWKVFQEMKQAALEGADCAPDERSYTTIITILGGKKMDEEEEKDSIAREERASRVARAAALFEEMAAAGLVQDQFAHNALMGAVANVGDHVGACTLLQRMRLAGCPADLITYGKVIDACVRGGVPLRDVMRLFHDMQVQDGLRPDMDRFHELVAALCRERMVEEAESVLQDLRAAGAVPLRKTYGAVLEMYAQSGLWREAEALLNDMRGAGLEPNSKDSELLVEAYAAGGRVAEGLATLRQMHARGLRASLRAYQALVEACGKANLPDRAGQLFMDMLNARVRPTAQVYAALIESFGRSGRVADAEATFWKMERRGIEPTQQAWAALIGAYGQGGWAKKAREAFLDLLKRGQQPGLPCFAALVDAYGKAGWLQDVALTIEDMRAKWRVEPDHPTLSSALTSLSRADSWPSAAPLIKALGGISRGGSSVAPLSGAAFSILSVPNGISERNVWVGLGAVLEGLKTGGREVAEGWTNLLLDVLWGLGLRRRAGNLLGLARGLGYYPGLWRFDELEWALDVRGLSAGGAEVVLVLWLSQVAKELDERSRGGMPWELVVVTGWGGVGGGTSNAGVATRAVSARLKELRSPFALMRGDERRLVAGAPAVLEWLRRSEVMAGLTLTDVEVPVHLLVESTSRESAVEEGASWQSQRLLSFWDGDAQRVGAALQGVDWSTRPGLAWGC